METVAANSLDMVNPNPQNLDLVEALNLLLSRRKVQLGTTRGATHMGLRNKASIALENHLKMDLNL